VRFDDLESLSSLASSEFGPWGPEIVVTQAMIDQFAALTGDRQWIHVDQERARREGPFGGTVAHGFLTLSLLPALNPIAAWKLVGHGSVTNYGGRNLRFLAPVPAGSALHARSRLVEAERYGKGSLVTYEMAVHVVGQPRPALLYQAQALYRP